jgi:hypothetical protein
MAQQLHGWTYLREDLGLIQGALKEGLRYLPARPERHEYCLSVTTTMGKNSRTVPLPHQLGADRKQGFPAEHIHASSCEVAEQDMTRIGVSSATRTGGTRLSRSEITP